MATGLSGQNGILALLLVAEEAKHTTELVLEKSLEQTVVMILKMRIILKPGLVMKIPAQ